ncbi:MAG TPA: BON domain-containing protein [Methylomirabilota bacterium]|nr:BON domain-containing protein [Methylomirabilota bacterium]
MRKLTNIATPAAVAAVAALLPLATVDAGDYRRTAYLEETASISPAAQNFSANEFFTQADRDLEKRIRVNLSVSLDRPVAEAADTLQIGVKEGAVALAGAVPDEWTKEEIERRTRRTLGVVSINNRIQVSRLSAQAETGSRALSSATTSAAHSTGAAPSRECYAEPRPLTDAERARLAAPAPPPPNDRELLQKDRIGSFPATQARAQEAVGERQETGSGNMHDEDRTGTTGPSGSRSFSTTTGSVDPGERFAKPAGDYAVTTVDRSIAERVRTMLNGDPSLFVTPDNVHIKVDNGYVILSGWANSQQEKDLITERVQEISGVQGVDNHLQVISRTGSRSGSR